MCVPTRASTMWLRYGTEELWFLCPRSVSACYRRLYNCMRYPEINCITENPSCPLSHAYTPALDLASSVDTSPSCYTEPSAINHMSMHTWLGTLRILFLCTAVQVNMYAYICVRVPVPVPAPVRASAPDSVPTFLSSSVLVSVPVFMFIPYLNICIFIYV